MAAKSSQENHEHFGRQAKRLPPAQINIAVDPVALVTTECITVTSAMRKHARWAHSSVSAILGGVTSAPRENNSSRSTKPNGHSAPSEKGPSHGSTRSATFDDEDSLVSSWGRRSKKGKSMQDNPLMSAFARLRSDLRNSSDIRNFDTPALLHPFLQVIRSSSTSASITSLAIVAITKFFDYNLISSSSPRLPFAMQLLSAAITHCRFEASDSAADEIVLLQILRLMESMFSGPGGDLLGDESVCEMMETGLSMCCQKRLSELVRRSAEMSMVKMCQVIFERLNTLEYNSSDPRKDDPDPDSGGDPLIMNQPAVNGAPIGSSKELQGNAPPADTERLLDQETSNGRLVESERSSAEARNSSEIGGTSNIAETVSRDPSKKDVPSLNDISNEKESLSSKLDRRTREAGENILEVNVKPYSLPSIRELFRVLVDLLRPQNREHNDALRVMALRIIDVALEVAGPSIAKHPSLASLAKDDLCRYLFQLIRTDSTLLLNESLRVSGTLLATCREVLKLQQELFLAYLIECLHPQVPIPEEPGILPQLYEGIPRAPRAASGRSTPVPVRERHQLGMDGTSRKPDAREAMIESIGALSRIPSYFVELYINYDCEVDRNDLCEELVSLLSRNAFPDSATWSTTSVPPLSLDSLLVYVQFIAERLDDEPHYQGYPSIETLQERRERKKIISQGALRFNADPRDGIAYLAAHGIIDNPNNPQSIANFLKSTTRIAKKKLGEYLSKRDQEPLLNAFMDTFDFAGKRVDEALRDLLNSFRLPGESQLIERIVTVFSQRYYGNTKHTDLANEDAVFTLTYSIIMLNTDQHNPNLKKEKRMSLQDFAKNLRGVNGGRDFNLRYLEEIFKSIKNNEIILPDEHDNEKAFEYTWEGLLLKARDSGPLMLSNTNVFDAGMFQATWKPIVATLSYVFMSASDDAVFSRVIQGFDQCAQIASRYGLSECLDRIVYCLSLISTISQVASTNTNLNTEVQVEKKSIMVSELAVKFGRNHKAQLACAVLFRLVSGKESSIHHGWKYIVNIWLNLFTNSLLPSSFMRSDDMLKLPPISLQPPSQTVDRDQRSDSGILSSFTSYLSSYAADDPPEPSEEEVESSLCTIDCLSSCPMDEIFSGIISMPPASSQFLVGALLEHLPEPSSPVVIAARPEHLRPTPIRVSNSQYKPSSSQAYDPATVFVLELSTILATRDSESMSLMGESVADALQTTMRDAQNIHPLVLARAISHNLRLLHASQTLHIHTILKTPVVLHTLSNFEQSVLEACSQSVLQGLSLALSNNSLRNEIINTPDFWLILSKLQTNADSASAVFGVLEDTFEPDLSALTADNYLALVAILDSFASAGSVGAVLEQQSARKQSMPQPNRDRKAQRDAELTGNHNTSNDKECMIRGFRAILLLAQVAQKVPKLIENSHLEEGKAWMTYWSPLFQKLQNQCLNPCRRIRRQAVSSLQTVLLSLSLSPSADDEWTFIFRNVLFGLVNRLLKPETYQIDSTGMNETRLQVANLLCRAFLHHLPTLSESDGLLDLWLRILGVMDRLMNAGQGESLEEAIPESLKNILLVMEESGILRIPNPEVPASRLWEETSRRVDRFLPGLIGDVFPQTKSEEDDRSKAPQVTEEGKHPQEVLANSTTSQEQNHGTEPKATEDVE